MNACIVNILRFLATGNVVLIALGAQSPRPDDHCRIPDDEAQSAVRKLHGDAFRVVETDHFRLISDCSLWERKKAAGSCERFYLQFSKKFMKKEMKPLTVYLAENREGFDALLRKNHGDQGINAWSIYYRKERAIYAMRLGAKGHYTGMGTLFCVMIDPIVDTDFPKPVPLWFAEGLSAFMEQARLSRGTLVYGCPQPRRGVDLENAHRSGRIPGLRRVLSQFDREFAQDTELNGSFVRTVFTYLLSSGEEKLVKFIDLMRQKKSGTYALESSLGKKLSVIEAEWKEHIEKVALGAAWAARAEEDPARGLGILEEGVAKFPRYGQIRSMLAFHYLRANRHDEAHKLALSSLEDPLFNRRFGSYNALGQSVFTKDPDLAIKYFEEGLLEAPWADEGLGPCYRNLASLLESRGRHDRAKEVRAELAAIQAQDVRPDR